MRNTTTLHMKGKLEENYRYSKQKYAQSCQCGQKMKLEDETIEDNDQNITHA